MKKLFLIPVAAALFTACSNETEPVVNDGPVALQISASNITVNTEVATRAAGDAWVINDEIGVYAVATTTTTTITDGANIKYKSAVSESTSNGTAFKTFTEDPDPIYLPANGAAIDVFAYYPYTTPLADPTAVSINVGTQNPQADIDFMTTGRVQYTDITNETPATLHYQEAITKAAPNCKLKFTHRLVKLQFNLKAGTGMSASDITGNTVALSIPAGLSTTASYNIYTDALSGLGGTSTPITPVEMASPGVWASGSPDVMADRSFEAIILPQTLAAAKAVTLTISKTSPESSAEYTFNIPNTEYAAGNKYIFNITVNATGLAISAAIEDWNPQTPISVTAQ